MQTDARERVFRTRLRATLVGNEQSLQIVTVQLCTAEDNGLDYNVSVAIIFIILTIIIAFANN